MAYIKIASENTDLSFILQKNPATGLQLKDSRQGIIHGWYDKNGSYNLWFRDSPTEVSYKEHPDASFEFVNTTRYNSAMAPVNMIAEFLDSALKKSSDKDVAGQYTHSLIINMIYLRNPKYVEMFKTYFEGFDMTAEEVAERNHKITFSTKKTFRDLLNFVNLFCLFNVLKNEEDFFTIDDATVGKYLNMVEHLNGPYFIRYVFKVNLLRKEKLFKQYLPRLEAIKDGPTVRFLYGSTSDQRRDFIKSKLTFEHDLVDIGCGEGNNLFMLTRKAHEDAIIHAIDKDPKIREDITHSFRKKQLSDRSFVHESFEDFRDTNERPYEAVFAEVLEHMPLDEGTELTRTILADPNLQRLILSTPNQDFNVHYHFDEDEMRHDDHHFEMKADEFKKWLEQFQSDDFDTEVVGVGDSVDGAFVTMAAIFKRKKKP